MTSANAEETSGSNTKKSGVSATERCINACRILGFSHPHFLMIHSRLQYVEQSGANSVGTMGITSAGRVLIDTDFVATLDREEIAGVMAHEMLHLIMSHHGRLGGRDPQKWNIATDMCINKALQSDDIRLPKDCLMPPAEYQGDLFAEALYEWLLKNPDKMPKPKKGGKSGNATLPGQGCAVIPDDKPLDGQKPEDRPDWRQVALEARAQAQAAGRGSQGVAHLLRPRQPKINWKKVIKHGFDLACARPGREWQTFAKRNRRSPTYGPQFPGWLGLNPKIALCIDVSGSMDRKWIDQIVAEGKNLLKSFPGTSLYLVAHTSEVEWEGWVNGNTTAKLRDAVQFSGGTDPKPAYDQIAKAGKFDSLIHMTDCEFFSAWPTPIPAKQLVVGAFCREIHTKPPPGSHILPCIFE